MNEAQVNNAQVNDNWVVDDWAAHVGEELRKTYRLYEQDGFFQQYFSGPNILDIGYKGYVADAQPIFPHAIGVDMDYPGYDGRTLPFPDESQDTVFASHALEHIPDYRQALREWFRVLRIGGHMVVAVPHQYLYERIVALPSRFNGDHQRLYTAAALMAEVEDALDPMSYRLRLLHDNDADFDYTIPPERHAGGCYELVMVLQRIRRPDYADDVLSPKPPAWNSPGQYLRVAKLDDHEPLMTIESDTPAARVLVMKLDHRGDFITAFAAFKTLREHFADAHLTLACGPWVQAEARQLGLFDSVLPIGFFPEIASQANHDSFPGNNPANFVKAVAGLSWDLAVDLRVDPDTRPLLAELDVKHRAGFGSTQEFPFLDIFLPFINPTIENRSYRRVLAPATFSTLVGRHEGFAVVHDQPGERRGASEVLIFGPYEMFEPGSWRMEVVIEPLGEGFDIAYDVCSQGGERTHQHGKLSVRPGIFPVFALELEERVKTMEIRLRMAEAAVLPPFRFLGIRAYKRGVLPALHQQEMQMLLANLVGLRMENPFTLRELPA